MDQIPIKYLVTQAQGLQQELGGETQNRSTKETNPQTTMVLDLNDLHFVRSALCPAEAAGHQLPTPVPGGGLGV